MSYISANLRYLRKLTGLSQTAFAEKVGLNRGNIASYEKGAAEPNSMKLLKIARFFNVELVDFIDKDLSKEIEENNINFSQKGESGIKFQKTPLSVLLEDVNQQAIPFESLGPLTERMASLQKILDGFFHFHQMRKSANLNPSQDILEGIIDYERLLKVSQELLELNRQLLLLIQQQE